MTQAQIDLLKLCIERDRRYRTMRSRGEWPSNDDVRGVELWGTGFSIRTARALADAGLIEIVDLYRDQKWAFLGRYEPFDL